MLTRGTASLSSVGSGVRAPASQTCGGPAFEEIHELLEQPGDDEVDDESDGEGEIRVIRRLAQLVDLLGEVLESDERDHGRADRKSTRLNSSHVSISYAVFCLKKKKQ